jgi:hypothetical protein
MQEWMKELTIIFKSLLFSDGSEWCTISNYSVTRIQTVLLKLIAVRQHASLLTYVECNGIAYSKYKVTPQNLGQVA